MQPDIRFTHILKSLPHVPTLFTKSRGGAVMMSADFQPGMEPTGNRPLSKNHTQFK